MNKTRIFLALLVIIGAILRFSALGQNPNSLTVDEVSIGYNAYSILKTGHDEYGNFLPLSFKSLGDYKPPLYIYLASLSESVFGLTEFAVRFPSALFGTLSILLFYIFFKELTGQKKYALVGAVLLVVSPWHLYFSRIASEALVANFLLVAGVVCLLRMVKGGWRWSIPAAGLLALSMYTYHSPRYFVPLLLAGLIYYYRGKNFRMQLRSWVVFLAVLTLISLPIGLMMLFGSGSTRAGMTVITHDSDFIRYVLIEPVKGLNGLQQAFQNLFGFDWLMLFFYWARKYLAYFQPSFLFYSGLNMTTSGSYGLGIMYLFELPFLVLGTVSLAKKKIPYWGLVFYWIFIGIIPASLTMNEQHPIRTMVVMPMTILLSAIGAVSLWEMSKKWLLSMRVAFAVLGMTIIIGVLLQAFLIFAVHFPHQKGEAFMEGSREAVEYILANQDKYNEIVFDPVRGVEGPYIVNVPHLYYLFYGKVDPRIYQISDKKITQDYYNFGKFTVRPIDWRVDRAKEKTLFIGSSWSLPSQDVSAEIVLKKINLLNNNLAFIIVSPFKK